jgi:S-adenosylmethionine-dependent methyltransferase
VSASGTFDEHQDAWLDYRRSPWARLRYAVVAHNLHACLGTERLRVLDVGGGDGGDAQPLLDEGHDVTVMDSSPAMLARAAERGLATLQGSLDEPLPLGFDAVLCHYVLQYRGNLSEDVGRLAGALRPGGWLSLIVPTAPGTVLAAAARSGLGAARAALVSSTMAAVTFGVDVRRFEHEEVHHALQSADFSHTQVFGIRCLNDLVLDDARKHEPDFFEDLLALELSVSGRAPFNLVGVATQYLARLTP